MVNILWLILVAFFFFCGYSISFYQYQKGLVEKANSKDNPIEYILGKPYALLNEHDYVEFILWKVFSKNTVDIKDNNKGDEKINDIV